MLLQRLAPTRRRLPLLLSDFQPPFRRLSPPVGVRAPTPYVVESAGRCLWSLGVLEQVVRRYSSAIDLSECLVGDVLDVAVVDQFAVA